MTRALLDEARKHDAAMTEGPWVVDGERICDGKCGEPFEYSDGSATGLIERHGNCRTVARDVEHAPDASGIAWLRTNLPKLLDLAELAVMNHERERQSLQPGQRDLVVEVCHDLVNRAMRNEADDIPSPQYAAHDRAKEAAVRALLDAHEQALGEVDALREAAAADGTRLTDQHASIESLTNELVFADRSLDAALRENQHGIASATALATYRANLKRLRDDLPQMTIDDVEARLAAILRGTP